MTNYIFQLNILKMLKVLIREELKNIWNYFNIKPLVEYQFLCPKYVSDIYMQQNFIYNSFFFFLILKKRKKSYQIELSYIITILFLPIGKQKGTTQVQKGKVFKILPSLYPIIKKKIIKKIFPTHMLNLVLLSSNLFYHKTYLHIDESKIYN